MPEGDDWKEWGQTLIGLLPRATDTSQLTVTGAIMDFKMTAAPSGWLKCSGAAFDGPSFPALQIALGGTTLPNLSSYHGAGYITCIKT